MNTIMHIAHNVNAAQVRALNGGTQNEMRLEDNIDNVELRLHNGVSRNLEVVHTSPVRYLNAEDILRSQQQVSDAVRLYENRISKRPPEWFDMSGEYPNDIA